MDLSIPTQIFNNIKHRHVIHLKFEDVFHSLTKLVPNAKAGIWSTSRENVLLHCVSFRYNSTKAQRKKCPYSELFWSVFSHIWTEYLSVFSPNAGKYGREKLRIRPFFTQ